MSADHIAIVASKPIIDVGDNSNEESPSLAPNYALLYNRTDPGIVTGAGTEYETSLVYLLGGIPLVSSSDILDTILAFR